MNWMMRKSAITLVLLLFVTGAALADTIYLKNGRERKGTLLGYENGEFIFELTNGNRVKFKTDRVERLVLDRDTAQRGPRDSEYRREGDTSTFSGQGQWETSETFDVNLGSRWVRSPIEVYEGQQVRVEASGTVTLDGRTTVTADGLRGQRDRNAPMPNENDGALIATIGQGFGSSPIYVGHSSEFVADRDGVLYFTINHGSMANSRGAFRVNVSVSRDRAYSDDERTRRSTAPAQGREKTITLYANQAWTDTGIDLEPNMMVEITVQGQIEYGVGRSTGPNGNRNANLSSSTYPIKDAGVGAVIARIRYRDGRDSEPLYIGSRNRAYTERNEYGRLLIGVNDDNYRDNSGSYNVTIRW
jgi:hypothetical protein